jgi:hypothetical protein
MVVKKRLRPLAVGEIELLEPKRGVIQPRQAIALQLHAVVVVQIVHADDGLPAAQQLLRQAIANEARDACD